MLMTETALGRLVPQHELQTVLEDAVLKVLLNVYSHPLNPEHSFVTSADLSGAVGESQRFVQAALKHLAENKLVEAKSDQFRISSKGVSFARTMPQGLRSVLR